MERNFKIKIGAVAVLLTAIIICLILLKTGKPKSPDNPLPVPSAEPSAAPETAQPEPTAVIVTPEPTATPVPTPAVTADIDSDDSITKYVSRDNLISETYVPSDLTAVNVHSAETKKLRKEAAEQLEAMFKAAINDRIYLKLVDGYRSYSYQRDLYNYYINNRGKEYADSIDAYPGASEHQLGLAADIGCWNGSCELSYCFTDYLDYGWLIDHSWEYGWIERYPKGMKSVTGVEYSPWHFRYIGVEEAQKYHESGASTLEEYFGIK